MNNETPSPGGDYANAAWGRPNVLTPVFETVESDLKITGARFDGFSEGNEYNTLIKAENKNKEELIKWTDFDNLKEKYSRLIDFYKT